jgi:DNA polymerase III sliding clamp (beta) subunit (PCNA family)
MLNGTVTVTATDKYRIAYSQFETDILEEGELLIPMSLIVQFLSAVKTVKNDSARVTIEEDGDRLTMKLWETEVGTTATKLPYPKTVELYRNFTAAESTDNLVWFDMKKLADIVKFADPSNTADKSTQWKLVKHASNGSWMLSKDDSSRFGVLVQSVLKK